MEDHLPSLATELAQQGLIKEAAELFTKWIDSQEDVDDYRVFFNRCWCLYEMDRYEDALKDATKVLELNNTFSKGYYIMGKILLELKNFKGAEKALNVSYDLDGRVNCEHTLKWIRDTIYRYLVHEGYDPFIAGQMSTTHSSIEDAVDFLEAGGFNDIVLQLVHAKRTKMLQLARKTGKIYPKSWFLF